MDSVAGGGGLITLPVLMNLGIDPKLALGTNKLQATFGSGSASWHYARAGTVSPSDCKLGFAVTFLGAALGTWLVQRLPRDFLMRAIPILLIVVAVYCIRLGDTSSAGRWSETGFPADLHRISRPEACEAGVSLKARISISCRVEGGVWEEEVPAAVAPEGFQT